MTIKEKLAQLNQAQANALARFYGATKTLERAEEEIQMINLQIQALGEFAEESDGPTE